ncbi:MAG: type II secretion system F family protein, partial [Gemmataceae bacterium]
RIEAVGFRIPALRGAYRSFALQRFSLALGMTHEAGMRSDQALALSFRASANLAYLKHGEPAAASVRGGKTIAKTLTRIGGGLFPDEFLDVVQIGESTGQLSEVMARQAEIYGEEASRRIKTLAMIAGGAVYALVGLMLIVLIFRIFQKAYLEPLNDAMKMNGFLLTPHLVGRAERVLWTRSARPTGITGTAPTRRWASRVPRSG